MSAIKIVVISFSGTPSRIKLRNDEKEKPVTGSTLPSASIGSRVGKPTGSTLSSQHQYHLLSQKKEIVPRPHRVEARQELILQDLRVHLYQVISYNYRKGWLIIHIITGHRSAWVLTINFINELISAKPKGKAQLPLWDRVQ